MKIAIPISGIDKETLPQLKYALTFASEDIVVAHVNSDATSIEAELKSETARESVIEKIQDLVKRYSKTDFGLPQTIHFDQTRDLAAIDAWNGLLERRWVTPVGTGHVVLRGPAANLLSLIDSKVDRDFARPLRAELEFYPATIKNETLDRCAHFTSFPEHMDFVANLKQDLDVLNTFSNECRQSGWSSKLHDGRMAQTEFSISPSCCYHCYEGMEGWNLPSPGRCITATLACHRFEGANHRSLSRLRAFTMREVIFVGQPKFVMDARAKGEELILQWAKDWELACTFESANDMFFTQDFSVKASFQRMQHVKKELRAQLPGENQSISIFSSNYHATTFGKAFNITAGGRPAASGCLGWGYERWVYAIFSQFGFDIEQWPAQLKKEYKDHVGTHGS